MRTDGQADIQTDRHDATKCRFLQFWESPMRTDRQAHIQTDMTQLNVAFYSFGKAPKNANRLKYTHRAKSSIIPSVVCLEILNHILA